ncbi:hypothetical protein RZN05_05010 [Sphingomonas sp. HF-S4]|uniref:Uncharacterized protein n=1 Tax=Sphingomonas agrestis TaxID=3080540 RepID=A0ABU3Y4J9_9SPHN|nr:hypothetical protein [Sphingomonas sp. HF-S4]MDV3456334.1 hypothetical protein [Sphingomonas sp. HF-S4]
MIKARPALRIDRARLANPRPGDRARLANALELVTHASTGVDARALLLIRRVRMRRPLAEGLEGFAGELIERIRAARTASGRGAVESVYFADEVALECAVVAAWLGGEALPELVRRAVPASTTPRLRWRQRLLADPVRLPRVIAALADTRLAGRWLAHFERGELQATADLLVRVYGGGIAPVERAEATPDVPVSEPPRQARARIPALVEAIAAARAETGEPIAQMLIAVSLLAVRRPELLATRAFVEAHADWIEAATAQPPARDVIEALGAEMAGAAVLKPSSRTGSPQESRGGAIAPVEGPRPGGSMRAIADRRDDLTGSEPACATTPATPRQEAPLEAIAVPVEAPPRIVASEHAGLFFLLNIFLALGLYGDFTRPGHGLRGLSPFELLLLLGRQWLGPGLAGDPLAPLLRELAGLGPRERVGSNFEAPAWRVQPEWLAPWPVAPQRAIRGPHGTSRWHMAGFPIADVWHAPRPESWMRRRWVACLGRYLEARIARALGEEDYRAAVAILADRPGTIRIDSERIEIGFLLDTHPLGLRLAGLDRDPGWIPAAGRSIGFRFA